MGAYYQYNDTFANTYADFITRLNAAFSAANIPLRAEYSAIAPNLMIYNVQDSETPVLVFSGVNDSPSYYVGGTKTEIISNSLSFMNDGRTFGIGSTSAHVALLWGGPTLSTMMTSFMIFGVNHDGAPTLLTSAGVTTGDIYYQDTIPTTVILDNKSGTLTYTGIPATPSTIIAGMEFPCTEGVTVDGAYWLVFPSPLKSGCTPGFVGGAPALLVCGNWLLMG